MYRPVWAGTINVEVAGWLVGIEYDSADTAALIEARCQQWQTDDQRPIRAAFGVRTVRVGWRRRGIGLVHYGTPVRQRTPDLPGAVDVLAAILAQFGNEPGDQQVAVPFRVFVNGSRAVLVDSPASLDIDDRPLNKRGIVEVPTWEAIVDTRGGGRLIGTEADLAGIVIGRPLPEPTADDARRHLWPMSAGDRAGWAVILDRFDDSQLVLAEDVVLGIRRLLAP